MQLTPVLIVSIVLFKLLPPFSMQSGILFCVSAILGYLVLYSINFIVWLSSFWFYWTFSIITIKDAVIAIMSGALFPLWFLPDSLHTLIKLTPFESIYFVPISIYLGQLPYDEIISSIAKQVIWLALLVIVGHIVWKRATKKLVVQGG